MQAADRAAMDWVLGLYTMQATTLATAIEQTPSACGDCACAVQHLQCVITARSVPLLPCRPLPGDSIFNKLCNGLLGLCRSQCSGKQVLCGASSGCSGAHGGP